LGGDTPYLKIKNHMPIEKKKIVLVKDSFTNPMATFLGLYYDEVHLYDLRGSREDFIEKLEEIEPDIVLCMYYPESLSNNKTFNFLPDPIEETD
jgi:hypothetical protein